MSYVKQTWANAPSSSSPISASRLNHLETQYEEAVADAANLYTPKITTPGRVYATDSSGGQTSIPVSSSASSGAVVQRSGTQVVVPATPSSSTHATSKSYVDSLVASVSPASTRVVACALRNLGGSQYWQPISDAGHSPIGVSSVDTFSDRIVVNFDFSGSKVVYGSATPDETLVSSNYTCGASVGTSSLTIWLSRTALTGYVSYSGGSWSVQGDFTFQQQQASGNIILDHPEIPGFGVSLSERDTPFRMQMVDMSSTYTKIAFTTAGGVKQATPASDHRGYISRIGGSGRIDPRPVPSGDHNIWVYALIQP